MENKKYSSRILATLSIVALLVFFVILCGCTQSSVSKGEYLYEDKELGISAYFPSEPTVKESQVNHELYGDYTFVNLYSYSDTGATELGIAYSDKWAETFNSFPLEKFKTGQSASMFRDLLNFLEILGLPQHVDVGQVYENTEMSTGEGYREATLIYPYVFSNEETQEEIEIYLYEEKIFTENEVYRLIGYRNNRGQAETALESFQLIS